MHLVGLAIVSQHIHIDVHSLETRLRSSASLTGRLFVTWKGSWIIFFQTMYASACLQLLDSHTSLLQEYGVVLGALTPIYS